MMDSKPGLALNSEYVWGTNEKLQSTINTIGYINQLLIFVKSIIMVIVIILFAINILRDWHLEKFELKIIVLMFISYSLHIYISSQEAFKDIDSSKAIKGFVMAVDIFYLWIYASQYIKACVLLPSMTKKAHLLIQSYHTTLANNCDARGLTSELIKRNDEIDKAI